MPSIPGETLDRRPREIVARQGNCFMLCHGEPMMALCHNGLTGIEVVDL
jgi:hypothetical protein